MVEQPNSALCNMVNFHIVTETAKDEQLAAAQMITQSIPYVLIPFDTQKSRWKFLGN